MKKAASSKPVRTAVQLQAEVSDTLAWLKRNSSAKIRDGMSRYGIPSDNAYGVPMNSIQKLAKQIGPDHELATALWKTEVYEARLLVAYIGEPAKLTVPQMDRWCRDFDNWAVVDTLCFALFNRSPHAWGRVNVWAKKSDEFVRRAGFALLACLSGPNREAADEMFLEALPLIEEGASDEHNFVKKGVSWALRMIGRRNARLHAAALEVAVRLASSPSSKEGKQPMSAAVWIGKETLKDLNRPEVKRRLAALEKKAKA